MVNGKHGDNPLTDLTIHGEPGVWTQYSERYYAAFVNDLASEQRRGCVACARAGRRRASPSRRSLIRTVQGAFANARARERDLLRPRPSRSADRLHVHRLAQAESAGARDKL